jgi:hypothetical protein
MRTMKLQLQVTVETKLELHLTVLLCSLALIEALNALSWSVEWQEGIVDLTACLAFEPTDSAALKLKAQVATSLPPQASTHPPTHTQKHSTARAHTHTRALHRFLLHERALCASGVSSHETLDG